MAKPGRPKSEGVPYPIKPYLTIKQTNWLDRQPNKSQVITNLIQREIMFTSIKTSIDRLNVADRIKVIAGETAFFVRLDVDGVVKTYNASKLYKHLDGLTELQFETNKDLFDRWIDIQLH